jgi:hypothetical protein
MRRLITALVATVAIAATVTSAQAITTLGEPDNGRHPEVGAMVGVSAVDGHLHAICTGALVAPRVFLTASHCVQALIDRNLPARVTFDEVITDGATTFEGEGVLNPLYDPKQGTTHDVSAIVLDSAPAGITPAEIPPRSDWLAAKQLRSFTLAGYGTNEQLVVKKKGPTYPRTDRRRLAVLGFDSLTKNYIHESMKRAQGEAGACYGDSGGPSFLGSGDNETDVVVAVTSTGDGPCYATNIASRTDTAEAMSFLHTLPGL